MLYMAKDQLTHCHHFFFPFGKIWTETRGRFTVACVIIISRTSNLFGQALIDCGHYCHWKLGSRPLHDLSKFCSLWAACIGLSVDWVDSILFHSASSHAMDRICYIFPDIYIYIRDCTGRLWWTEGFFWHVELVRASIVCPVGSFLLDHLDDRANATKGRR